MDDTDKMLADFFAVNPWTPETMGNQILAMIEADGDTTFPRIERLFGAVAKGDLCWECMPNVILWNGMSRLLIDALNLLRTQGRIAVRPTEFLVYLCDGAFQNLPIARKPPQAGYKKLHWLPVVLVLPGDKGNAWRGSSTRRAPKKT